VRSHLGLHLDALLLGITIGVAYGLLHWWQLRPKVTRQDRRFARNKILVNYLSVAEVAVAAVAYNHYLAIPLVIAVLAAFLLGYFSVHWWTVLVGSFGVGGTIALGVCILREEQKSGPIYYQYDNQNWQGSEGMLYKVGRVVCRLAPEGKVRVNGELWNAVSISGEEIEEGEKVEVLQLDGLTLHVDRVPQDGVKSRPT
jgi:membrane-bound ClpP family serine protease